MDKALDKVKWYHSIRWKLALSYVFVSLAPMIFFYSAVLVSIERHYIEERQSHLRYLVHHEANILSAANYLERLMERPLTDMANRAIAERSSLRDHRTLIFDNRFMVVNDTNMVRTGHTIIVPEVVTALTDVNVAHAYGLNRTEEVIYAAAAIFCSEGHRAGVVLLSQDVQDVFVSIDVIRQMVLLYTLLASVFIIVLVFFAAQFLIDPLRGVLRVVQRMAEGHLWQRIPVTGQDEYNQLAIAFNNMTEKLEQVEKAREEFVSNVSHELKTPLSSMKVLAESILLQDEVPIETHKEFLQDITSEVDRMTNIVNDLLSLVKLDRHEHGFHTTSTELNELIEDVLKRLAPLAEQKRIILMYEGVRQVTMDVDEVKLSLAISNIVENGIKYTPNGGTVKVIVDADHQNAFITIQDTGIGIPEEEQSKIFNRFYRVDKTRDRGTGGTGLGLAISHAAVLLHNGSVRLSSKPEEGSVFIVRLPIRRGGVV